MRPLLPPLRVALLAATVTLAAIPALHAAPLSALPDPLADPLAHPDDYSFAPPPSTALPPDPPVPSSVPHGVVTSTVGNRGEGGSVALESVLPDGRTHVFLGADGGQETPWKHGPTITSRDVAVGVSTVLPDDTAIMLQFDAGQANWSRR